MSKEREITLIKNNDNKDWEDLEWTQFLYRYLRGQLPKNDFKNGGVNLSKAKAFRIIYFLQEHFPVIPDHIEQCSTCGELYDSYSQGHHSELTSKFYCSESCEPNGIYEREQKHEEKARKLLNQKEAK